MPARSKSLLSMCEWIRRVLMACIRIKFTEMSKSADPFTPKVMKTIEDAKAEGTRYCRIFWGGRNTREFDHNGKTFVVDFEKKSCTCRKWDLTGIPCPHVMCCIAKEQRELTQYVDDCYTKETYLKAYSEVIHAMPG